MREEVVNALYEKGLFLEKEGERMRAAGMRDDVILAGAWAALLSEYEEAEKCEEEKEFAVPIPDRAVRKNIPCTGDIVRDMTSLGHQLYAEQFHAKRRMNEKDCIMAGLKRM